MARTVFYPTVTIPPSTAAETPHADDWAVGTNQPQMSFRYPPRVGWQVQDANAMTLPGVDTSKLDATQPYTYQPRMDFRRLYFTQPSPDVGLLPLPTPPVTKKFWGA